MNLFPATLYINDMICLALGGLVILLSFRAFQMQSTEGHAAFLFLILTALALLAGVANIAVNLVMHDFAHSWRVALLVPGLFMLPLLPFIAGGLTARLLRAGKAIGDYRRRA